MNANNILETIKMIEEEKLDIRTITMGISLLDCIDSDGDKAREKIYNKITTYAKDLVKVGDEIELKYNNDNKAQAKVSEIVEHYINHYIYIDSNYYKSIFNRTPKENSIFIKLVNEDTADQVSNDLINIEGIAGIVSNNSIKTSFSDTIKSLDLVVIVMILCAGALSFIVLYNLTNVNISERIREIATIKVLGFYDKEVSAYIFRENILLTIIGTLAFMLSVNVFITIVVVVVTPLSFFIARFIAKKTFNMFSLQSKTRGEQTSFIDEMISNQKVAEAYSMNEENKARFDKINDDLAKYSLKATFFSSITNPATRFVNSIVYAAVALFGAIMAVKGNITVGILSCFLSYANQYTKPFNEISSVVTELQNAIACAARVFELIEEAPELPDKADATELENVKGSVEINNLYFSYNPDRELLKNVNINVEPGKTVAIVGPTGCGKTTLINLLMRFYDPNNGAILVDEVNTQDVTRQSLRQNFGMVLQDTWLKSGTIADNIRLGKTDATDDEIIEAAKKAHAHSFIKRLPNGYKTKIGEDGGSLSQGQKQLLCITRLMLCPPPMLILDEATSSIDTRTEIKIQKAFNTLMKNRTTFIVAHRLSTIQNADLILVMNDGNIIEQGTHASLYAQKGFYYNLYNSQFSKT